MSEGTDRYENISNLKFSIINQSASAFLLFLELIFGFPVLINFGILSFIFMS